MHNMPRCGSQLRETETVIVTDVIAASCCCCCRSFDGADMQGAQFENSILTGATFGKDGAGNWANLKVNQQQQQQQMQFNSNSRCNLTAHLGMLLGGLIPIMSGLLHDAAYS
jgi:hypothetical protein